MQKLGQSASLLSVIEAVGLCVTQSEHSLLQNPQTSGYKSNRTFHQLSIHRRCPLTSVIIFSHTLLFYLMPITTKSVKKTAVKNLSPTRVRQEAKQQLSWLKIILATS